jgi:hypothetical protein
MGTYLNRALSYVHAYVNRHGNIDTIRRKARQFATVESTVPRRWTISGRTSRRPRYTLDTYDRNNAPFGRPWCRILLYMMGCETINHFQHSSISNVACSPENSMLQLHTRTSRANMWISSSASCSASSSGVLRFDLFCIVHSFL